MLVTTTLSIVGLVVLSVDQHKGLRSPDGLWMWYGVVVSNRHPSMMLSLYVHRRVSSATPGWAQLLQ